MLRPSRASCVVLASLLGCAVPAFAAGSGPALVETMESATGVTLVHSLLRETPLERPTRKPCAVIDTSFRRRVALPGDWTRLFFATLGVPPRVPSADSCGTNRRRSRTTWQALRIEFQTSASRLSADIDFAGRQVELVDPANGTACIPMADSADRLFEMVRAALPGDTILEAPGNAPETPPDLSPSGQVPPLGSWVYVEELPEAIKKVPPEYPNQARVEGVSGTVIVQALLDERGQVVETRVVHSIPQLDREAVLAVEQWQFKPARAGGVPLKVWVAIPVKFTLR